MTILETLSSDTVDLWVLQQAGGYLKRAAESWMGENGGVIIIAPQCGWILSSDWSEGVDFILHNGSADSSAGLVIEMTGL